MAKKPQVKALREVISERLGIKTSRIYAKANALATKVQTRTEDGIYLLAAESGINLNRYLPKERVDQIRQLLFQLNQQTRLTQPMTRTSKLPVSKSVAVRVGKEFTLADPLLSDKVLAEAKEMAEEVYPLLYVFENSVREVILRIMQKAHGPSWWDTKVPSEIRKEVVKRKVREDENPWHGKRGAHPIYYTDLDHLGRIVQNNWVDFKKIFPRQQWLEQRLDEISHSRNPVAHMNPLRKNDIQRVKVYFRDWETVIRAKRDLLP